MIKKFQSYLTYLILKLYNKNLIVGKNFICGKSPSISKKNSIKIGDNFYMGNYCDLSSNLEIGNNVLVGSKVSFVGGDHKIDNIKDKLIRNSGRDVLKTTIIEDNVWIGTSSIILQGIYVASGSVIAAGSVLTKSTRNNEIWAGNPATLIRKRK
jgi:acetyltransferase-like isoleucine patch superfamily enzyme